MILYAALIENFFNWHAVIYFFLWRWRGLLDLVHKSRHRRVARHALVLRPTELYFRHAVIQILPDICRYILSNIHKFNSPDRLTYIRFFSFALFQFFSFLFFLADSIGKRSHWGFDPSPYPSITTHASVPPYTQSQGLSVTGKFFRSE